MTALATPAADTNAMRERLQKARDTWLNQIGYPSQYQNREVRELIGAINGALALLATDRAGVGEEGWPGRNAELDADRVRTLATLGLMLSVMAGGEAPEVTGFDASKLYDEVLMALAIEDSDSPDIDLESARDHPEEHTLLAASPAPADAGGEVEQERMPRDLAYAFVGGLRLSQKRHAAHAMGIKYESNTVNLEGEKAFLHAVEQAGRVHELRVIVAGMLPALKGEALLARAALSAAGA